MKYKIIFHISDIHIRLLSRKEEYEYIFKEVYKYINEHSKRDESLIVITGDILHNKLDLTPDCILMTYNFLVSLSKMCKTIFIAGNHDALIHNLNRTDSLTSIIYGRCPENLYYLKETNWYEFDNIIFGVKSLLDSKELEEYKKEKDKIKIGLYHGQMSGWRNNYGLEMKENCDTTVEEWKDFDYVLLGDIHKYQYMNKEKTIAYSGSLISQNFGETDLDHGILIWDLENKNSKFHRIHNPYGYMMGYLNENHLNFYNEIIRYKENKDYEKIPEKINLKIICNNNDDTQIFMKYIKKYRPKIKVQFNFQNILSKNEKEENINKIENNIYNNEKLIRIYIFEKLKNQCSISEIENVIKDIQKEYNIYIQNQMKEYTKWELESLLFSNMFGYGENNFIELNKLDIFTITGIFGKNSFGKSTLIDIICFMLYGKLTRACSGNSIPKEIIHFDENESYGELIFKIGNIRHKICKKCTRKKDKIKIIEKLYSYENNNWNEITEEHRKKTDKWIEKWIGPIENFLFTNICLQQKEKPFRDLTQKDKKEFLYHLLGLNWFDEYRQKIDEQFKISKGEESFILKQKNDLLDNWDIIFNDIDHKINLYNIDIKNIKDNINSLSKEKDEYILYPCKYNSKIEIENELQLLEKDENELENKLNEILISKKKIINKNIDLSDLQYQYNHLKNKIEILTKIVHEYQTEPVFLELIKLSIIEWKTFYQEHSNIIENKEIVEKYNKFKTEIDIKEYELKNLLNEKRNNVKKIQISSILKEEWKNLSININNFKNEMILNTNNIELETNNSKESRKKICEIENDYNYINDIYQEFLMLNSQIQIYKENYKQIQSMTFNDQCNACISNPYYIKREQLKLDLQLKEKSLKNLSTKLLEKSNSNDSLDENDIFNFYKNLLNHEKHILEKSLNRIDLLKKNNQNLKIKIDRFEELDKNIQIKILESKLNDIEKDKISNPIISSFKLYQKTIHQWKLITIFNNYILQFNEIPILDINIFHLKLNDIEKHIKIMQNEKDYLENLDSLIIDYSDKKLEIKSKKLLLKQDLEHWISNSDISLKKNNLDKSIQTLNHNLNTLHELIISLKIKKENKLIEFNQWKIFDEQYQIISLKKKHYENILSCIDRDGLPFYLLKQYLPLMEQELNSLLLNFIDKKIIFQIKEKDIIIGFQHDNTISLFMGGMESFICDLAFKFVFSKFGKIPSSNFFIIDEGISVFDQDRIRNINILFEFLSNIIEYVFIITHLPHIEDYVTNSIFIHKNANKSFINT